MFPITSGQARYNLNGIVDSLHDSIVGRMAEAGHSPPNA